MAESSLRILQQRVERRVAEISGSKSDWPCRKGCDHCCRRLAAIPTLTLPEWVDLKNALPNLPAAQQTEIAIRIAILNAPSPEPGSIVCPLLDLQSGTCLVYPVRPVACRTYGFYIERDKGLFCGMIQSRVDGGDLDDVIWGNGEAIDRELASLGDSRTLIEWTRAEPLD